MKSIKQLNEELEKFLESDNEFIAMLDYLKEIGTEKYNGFFILSTTPEIRAWEYRKDNRIDFRCEGIYLDVEFKDNIEIKQWLNVKETLPINTTPEQILNKLQEMFKTEIETKKKEEEERAKRQQEWNEKVKVWQKEWEDNLTETTEILNALKDNGFTNFIFTEDAEAYNDFGGNTIDELLKELDDYLDYEADTKWYVGSLEDKGLIIGDWEGTVSGTYLGGSTPDDLHDVNYEEERSGDIYLSEDTFDFILEKFPESYLAKCLKESNYGN